jgi:ribosomal protein L31E
MADDETPEDEMTITVPLRRLLTGVPRTQRAAASIPRIKRYVQRHVKKEWWRDAEGRILIDDFLNKTLWRRGREHIAGPEYWIGKKGESKRLARRSPVRYGSVLKVKVLYVEPRDGDPFIELRLPGFEDLKKERREKERERKARKSAAEEGAGAEAVEEEGEEGEEEAKEPAAEGEETEAGETEEGPADEKPADLERGEKPAAEPPKKAPKPASKSAAAKGGPKESAKAESKKPAAKPKKEGGD